jgi:hypothetical protein
MTQSLSEITREAFGAKPDSATNAVSETLTANDRCDVGQCGAQAYVFVQFNTGSLLFCGHHFTESESAIRKTLVLVVDERQRLAVKLGGSA